MSLIDFKKFSVDWTRRAKSPSAISSAKHAPTVAHLSSDGKNISTCYHPISLCNNFNSLYKLNVIKCLSSKRQIYHITWSYIARICIKLYKELVSWYWTHRVFTDRTQMLKNRETIGLFRPKINGKGRVTSTFVPFPRKRDRTSVLDRRNGRNTPRALGSK